MLEIGAIGHFLEILVYFSLNPPWIFKSNAVNDLWNSYFFEHYFSYFGQIVEIRKIFFPYFSFLIKIKKKCTYFFLTQEWSSERSVKLCVCENIFAPDKGQFYEQQYRVSNGTCFHLAIQPYCVVPAEWGFFAVQPDG